jgi:hypothetical protein
MSKEKLIEIKRLIGEYNSESHEHNKLILQETIWKCCSYKKCQLSNPGYHRTYSCNCREKYESLEEEERCKFAYFDGELFLYPN